MTFREVEQLMPNGFHDSFLKSIRIDYISRRAELELEIWVGSMDKEEAEREACRRAQITFTGLLLCIVETPNQDLIDDTFIGLSFDAVAGDFQYDLNLHCPGVSLPDNAFAQSFHFADQYNSFGS